MSIKAYLCPNMINFDVVNFSERRSEEVMFLLTLSVLRISTTTKNSMPVYKFLEQFHLHQDKF